MSRGLPVRQSCLTSAPDRLICSTMASRALRRFGRTQAVRRSGPFCLPKCEQAFRMHQLVRLAQDIAHRGFSLTPEVFGMKWRDDRSNASSSPITTGAPRPCVLRLSHSDSAAAPLTDMISYGKAFRASSRAPRDRLLRSLRRTHLRLSGCRRAGQHGRHRALQEFPAPHPTSPLKRLRQVHSLRRVRCVRHSALASAEHRQICQPVGASGQGSVDEDDTEFSRGSGNLFRDFGRPDADLEQLRAILAAKIIGVLDDRELSVRKAAEITGVDAGNSSRIRRANFRRLTVDRLMTILARLDQQVDVNVTARPKDRHAMQAPGG